MKYILILTSFFLSSGAEARHGDYYITGSYGLNGPRNFVLGGGAPRARHRYPASNPFVPLQVPQDFIWPPFPAPSLRYRR